MRKEFYRLDHWLRLTNADVLHSIIWWCVCVWIRLERDQFCERNQQRMVFNYLRSYFEEQHLHSTNTMRCGVATHIATTCSFSLTQYTRTTNTYADKVSSKYVRKSRGRQQRSRLKRLPFIIWFDVQFCQTAVSHPCVLYVCVYCVRICAIFRSAYYLKSPYASPLLPTFSTTVLRHFHDFSACQHEIRLRSNSNKLFMYV